MSTGPPARHILAVNNDPTVLSLFRDLWELEVGAQDSFRGS